MGGFEKFYSIFFRKSKTKVPFSFTIPILSPGYFYLKHQPHFSFSSQFYKAFLRTIIIDPSENQFV